MKHFQLETKEQKEERIKNSKPLTVLGLISWVGGAIIGYMIVKFLGIIVAVIFLFAFLIGVYFPGWYFKRQKVNYTFIKWFVWSNILTWFLPPLGILTGFAAFGFSNLVKQEKKKYKILAIIGIILSLINAIVGIIIRL